jgi:hypothetical protein
MLTTALNRLVLMRNDGLRLVHWAGREGLGPVLIGMAFVGVIIWALSRFSRNLI